MSTAMFVPSRYMYYVLINQLARFSYPFMFEQANKQMCNINVRCAAVHQSGIVAYDYIYWLSRILRADKF